MSYHITSALKFKPLPRCHLRPTNTPPAALQLHTRDDLVHLCCARVMLLTTVQLPSESLSSRPSLHRAFSFLSQYSDESSTLLLHSTCSTRTNPAQVQRRHWNRTEHMTPRRTVWVTHSLSSVSLWAFSPSGCRDQLTFLQGRYSRISVRGTRSIICQLTRHGRVYTTVIVSSLERHF